MVFILHTLPHWLISNCFLLETPTIDVVEDASDNDLPEPFIGTVHDEMPYTSTPAARLKQFQLENIDNENFPQRIFLSQIDGVDELKNVVLSVYKNPNTNLRVIPKIRFEDESAVGSGPIRENHRRRHQ